MEKVTTPKPGMKQPLKQWSWLILIWVGSVASLALVSFGFRALMQAAGFKS
ncbi:DUF2474 domain-containing protein [Photobacterium atrarenae]|uniref:DUF2474 domain-containing protein n=1 Tax=Photobacterium atrarenae TaxID=865757 RepID=UPI003F720C76